MQPSTSFGPTHGGAPEYPAQLFTSSTLLHDPVLAYRAAQLKRTAVIEARGGAQRELRGPYSVPTGLGSAGDRSRRAGGGARIMDVEELEAKHRSGIALSVPGLLCGRAQSLCA